ncbi:putative holin [Salmonella enterica]|uniref:putative holin n=1 Tax=Salmonella enterica TaxID=28901 RepID=UPI003D30FC4A
MFQLLGQDTVWIILGAIAGSTVFVVSASEYILSVRIILFVVSVIIGIICADLVALALTHLIDKHFSVMLIIHSSVGAVVASTLSIRVLVFLGKRIVDLQADKSNHI